MTAYDVGKAQLDNALKNALNEKEVLSLVDNQDRIPVKLGSGGKWHRRSAP